MSKEKLTPKIVSKEIIENFDTLKLSWNGITGIEFHIVTLLKQIQDEIICVEDEPISEDSYFGKEDIFVSITKIVKAFNKYINEK
jgi:hypothetical protein